MGNPQIGFAGCGWGSDLHSLACILGVTTHRVKAYLCNFAMMVSLLA
jgi:hypothetical protein